MWCASAQLGAGFGAVEDGPTEDRRLLAADFEMNFGMANQTVLDVPASLPPLKVSGPLNRRDGFQAFRR